MIRAIWLWLVFHFMSRPFQLASDCQIRCGFCSLWKEDENADGDNERHAENSAVSWRKPVQQWLGRYKWIPWVNIIGGDPFMNPSLPSILAEFKSAGKKLRLFSHGMVDWEHWEAVLPYVDELYFYMPSSEAAIYREITGLDDRDRALDLLRELKKQNLRLVISMPIRNDTVQWLPEMYELAFDMGLPLAFHIMPGQRLSSESKAFVWRYSRVKNVQVFYRPFFANWSRVRAADKAVCPAVEGLI